MPQIAQQDYIIVNITNPNELTEQENREIASLVKKGVIYDVLFLIKNEYSSRPLFVRETSEKIYIGFTDYEVDEIAEIEVTL